LRHWQAPFQATTLTGAYVSVSVTVRDGLEIWREADPNEVIPWRRLVVQRGADIEERGDRITVLSAALIDDVAEQRLFTRSSVNYHAGVGYTLLAGVIREYLPGEEPLLPALFFSPSGAPDSWRYLGKLSGEPAAFAHAHYVWSDGGSVFRLDDGRWRIYLNGYGVRLAALESDALSGPWRFLRTREGAVRDLADALPQAGGYAFPTVLRVSEREWHAWLSFGWPAASIWHLWSQDGLAWRLYGQQPEITPAAVGNRTVKNLRAYFDPRTNAIVGLLSVWDTLPNGEEGWLLYRSRLR
jgi:hypothetical protein